MARLLASGTVLLQQLCQERRMPRRPWHSDAHSPWEHRAWPGACRKRSDITEGHARERGVCQCPSGDVSADLHQTFAIPAGFSPLQTGAALADEMRSAEATSAQPRAARRAERCPEHPTS